MNKLYNGKEATKENVLAMLKDVDTQNDPDDMTDEEKAVVRKVAYQNYDGADEDIEYLTEKLNVERKWGYEYPRANLQNVYDILSQGKWYYQAE